MDEQILLLLKKYLDNRCTSGELLKVKRILSSGGYEQEWAAALQEDADQVLAEDNGADEDLDGERKEALLNRILQTTGAETKSSPQQTNEYENRVFPLWLRAAASILILLMGGLVVMISFWSSADELSQSITDTGQQTEMWLHDGTSVWLNDRSELRYPDEFDEEVREVYLSGDAFFDVVSNPAQPFLLYSGDVTIEVLGTSFNVRAYEDDQNITVTLATGSVSVIPENKSSRSSWQLSPGEQWVYNKTTGNHHIQEVSAGDLQAIQDGEMVFLDQPLGDITRALERRFDLRFRFERESLQQQQLTYKAGSSDVDEALQILSLAAGFEYRFMENGEIFIR